MADQLTDEQLLTLYASTGDDIHLSTLYTRYVEMVYGVCLKYYKNSTEAKDAASEVYLLLLRRTKGKEIDNWKPWLYTVVKNYCLEQLRSRTNKMPKQMIADRVYSEEVFHPTIDSKDEEVRKLEICIDSVESAEASQAGGADRVELCGSLLEGGVTPTAGMIAETRKRIDIGLQVMIRSRGGDFFFSEMEHAVMRHDVEVAKDLGADGIVIGCLNPDGTVDIDNSNALIELARPLNVTFHRAFDMTLDPFEALDTLIELGVDRILTSGQEPTVLEGADLIAALGEKAGDDVIILPGGGVTHRNLEKIIELTGVSEIHVGTRQAVGSGMQFRNERVYMGGELRPPEYERLVAARTDVQNLRASLDG